MRNDNFFLGLVLLLAPLLAHPSPQKKVASSIRTLEALLEENKYGQAFRVLRNLETEIETGFLEQLETNFPNELFGLNGETVTRGTILHDRHYVLIRKYESPNSNEAIHVTLELCFKQRHCHYSSKNRAFCLPKRCRNRKNPDEEVNILEKILVNDRQMILQKLEKRLKCTSYERFPKHCTVPENQPSYLVTYCLKNGLISFGANSTSSSVLKEVAKSWNYNGIEKLY